MNHTQLTRQRTLLILEDTELYAFNSSEPNSWLTIQKGEIQSPKTVKLLEVSSSMFKVSIARGKNNEIQGWIPRDQRVWGDDLEGVQKDFD